MYIIASFEHFSRGCKRRKMLSAGTRKEGGEETGGEGEVYALEREAHK